MGQVFAAFDRVRQEDVALKVLLPHLVPDPHARDRFLNEARIATSLAHPSVVRVYDIHETVDRTFLTMELLQGRTLRQEIVCRQATSKRFSVEEVGHIAKRCARRCSMPTATPCTGISSRRTSGCARMGR